MDQDELIVELTKINVIKKGHFVLKSGNTSEIYLDFRHVMGYPDLFQQVCKQLAKLIPERDVALLGVPTAGVPYASVLAAMLHLPLITCRDKPKEHGLQKIIEGDDRGRDIVLIEDIFTTGSSVTYWSKLVESQGKTIRKVVTIVDRRSLITPFHFPVESLFTLHQLVSKMEEKNGYVGSGDRTVTEKNGYVGSGGHTVIEKNGYGNDGRTVKKENGYVGSGGRTVVVKNRVCLELLRIVRLKQTNLVVSIDLSSPESILKMIKEVGIHVCAIKLHWDLIDFSAYDRDAFATRLILLKQQLKFLLIEDRKFADIGVISGMQLDRVPTCFDMVTVHALAGELSLMELDTRGKGLLVVYQMSNAGNLLDQKYQDLAGAMLSKLDNVVGAIGQQAHPTFLTMTPGIHLDEKQDSNGQTYKPPTQDSGDLFIVGRAICSNQDPASTAAKYKTRCWQLFNNPFTIVSKL